MTILSIGAAALTVILAVAVLLGAGCRLLHMQFSTHKRIWLLMYVAMIWGAGAALTGVSAGRWEAIPLLIAVLIYLWVSRAAWRAGTPIFTQR